MKYIANRDRRRRLSFNKIEIQRVMGCCIIRSAFVSQLSKEQVRKYWYGKVRFRNRCIYTGRGKSVSRYFGISRMKLLEMSRGGNIKGSRKGTW